MAAQEVVAVTGASGYIAGSVIELLLKEGYSVRGTVRDLSNQEKVQHLQEAFPSLQLFEADLLKDGSFTECFQGATYVMHTASPFQLSVSDPQKDLVDPALQGTLNVLNSAKKAGVKRVVVTSSCAAIASQAIPSNDKVWTEDDWNNDSSLTEGPYRLSKSLAEKAAWKFVKENSDCFELAVINPSFVLGPPFSSRVDSVSVSTCKAFLNGDFRETGARNSCFGCVDVRDIARAHVEAMKREEAAGMRFLCSSTEGIDHMQLVEWLRQDEHINKSYGDKLPTKLSAPIVHRPKYDHSRAESVLGIEFTPISKSIVDMAHALEKLGVVSSAQA